MRPPIPVLLFSVGSILRSLLRLGWRRDDQSRGLPDAGDTPREADRPASLFRMPRDVLRGFLFVLSALQIFGAGLTPVDPRCDGMVNPLGVDATPRFSWKLHSPDGVRGARQTAWQLKVGEWDSGRVESAEQLNVNYSGRPLHSHEQVSWQVRVWDEAGRVSEWSAPQAFTVGVLTLADWLPAKWITDVESLQPAPAHSPHPRANATLLFRREFAVRAGLHRALLHVSGLGQYELTVNGRAVDDGLLTPGWTAYEKTVLYDTHDVTAGLRSGTNTLGLTLASGMYSVQPGRNRFQKFTSPFRPLTAIALLRLEYADGSVETVATDASWRVAPGPTDYANIYGGEDHDARPALAKWEPAAEIIGPGGELRGVSHASPPFRTFETLKPVATRELRPGVTVYDLGQNASLMLSLRVTGPAGSRVKILPAELLKADGSVDRNSSSHGGGDSSWNYTLAGTAGGEQWQPKFFYHGARYLQVERTDGVTIDAIEGWVAHSDSPPAGEFACSSELFNRIRTLIRWAQCSNLAHVITDCPHRERLGWLEQYHLNGPALRYEWDLARLYGKTFDDMADAQTPDGLVPDIAPEYVVFEGGFRDSPEWGSALILAAWQHYVWTGDDTPLRRHYFAMRRYLAYLDSKATGHLLSHGLGDWYDLGPKRPGVSQLTPVALTATAIYYEDIVALAGIAQKLGREADAQELTAHAAEVKAAFNRKFLDAEKAVYATGSQTAHALPLVLGLVPEEKRAAVLAGLVKDVQDRGNAITAGDVGYRYLLRALAEGGRSDVIYAMNAQSDKPGYGYQLAHGATSLTEAWNADPHSSQNHFMLGQIMEWFYHDLAGLAPDPAAPGFASVLIAPQPVAGITWAKAAHESPRGRVAVSWKKANGTFTLDVILPPNTTGKISLPAPTATEILESGRPATGAPGVKLLRRAGGRAVFAVESGHYEFSAPFAPPGD